MFFVYNKDKIISVFIALSTVLILFLLATTLKNENLQAIQTSSNTEKLLPIYSVETAEKKVALTINCAWSAEDIDLILETLEKHKIKITFFMVGDWVGKYQEETKKIYDAGHEIGNHSYSHPHVNNLSYNLNKEEIQKCSDLIRKVTGKETTLYRGPYGEYNNTVLRCCKRFKTSDNSMEYRFIRLARFNSRANVGKDKQKTRKWEYNINA